MAVPGQSVPSQARCQLSPGELLGARYRLTERLTGPGGRDGGSVQTWRGLDEVLDRVVRLRILCDGDPAAAEAFLRAATVAGPLTHPGLTRVYDAAQEPGRPLSYQVGEWVDGTSLSTLLADAPLEPHRACALAGELAAAVCSAHEAGVVHGSVHPGNVRITAAGHAVLGDTALGDTARGDTALGDTASGESRPDEAAPSLEGDAVGIVATLYAALTGRWPLTGPTPAEVGLPPAPRRDSGELCTPREVRAGVPRHVDALVRRGLPGPVTPGVSPLRTAAEIAAALRPFTRSGPARSDEQEEAPVAPRRRRWWPIAVVGLALAGAGAGGGYLASAAGTGAGTRTPPSFRASAQPGHARVSALVPVPIASVTSFDPGHGPEHPELVGYSDDGNPATSWYTETYASAAFGNLKAGTGLLFDLGRPVAVREVVLDLVAGEDVELRAASNPSANASGYRLVASLSPAPASATLRVNATSRYWLVWITMLPPAPYGGYRGGVAEVRFLR